ncbi:MAG: hypothetical protein IKE58_04875 [Blautia sp.]|nr:hypothetical protein [Blautia sp.]
MSYYDRYIRQTRIFQGTGITLLVAAILINEIVGRTFPLPLLILAGIGIIPLVIGGSGSTPHGIVKAFASLLQSDPTTVNAKEFLTALNTVGKVALVKNSRQLVEHAIYAYEHSKEAEEDVVSELKAAVEKNIKKKAF